MRNKLKLGKIFAITALFFGAIQMKSQCTVTISQNPPGLLCSVNPTLTAVVAGGALTIDQNQPSNTTCMANFAQTGLAQSFVPSINTICGAGLFLTSNGAGVGTVTISLWTNLPNMGGTMLTTGTVSASDNTWADVFWPSPVSVTPGTTYYLVFEGSNGSQCAAGNTSNPYAGGNVYANPGYNAFSSYDYTFHTYSGCGAIASYIWSTGSTSAAITATATGVYNVTITVGACTTTAVQSLTINPTPSISVNSGSICSGQQFTMVPNGANTYTFQGGSAIVSPTMNATYTVVGTSSAGCVSQTVVSNVTVNAVPTISVNSGMVCAGNPFTLTPSGANTYTFQGGNAVVSPTANTSYTVIGTSTAGCVSNTFATSNITVSASPSVAISGNTLICGTGTNVLTTGGADTYSWSTGAVTPTISASPTITTSYSVVVTNTLTSCSNTFVTSILVSANPSVSITGGGTVCAGSSATLTGNGANTYSWSTGSGSSSIVVTPSTNTTYTAKGTTTTGCSNTVTTLVTVIPCSTGLNQFSLQGSAIKVYPNPGAGEFTIELNNGLSKTIQVSDLTGRIVLSINSSTDKTTLNISHLSNGIYYLKIQSNNALEVIKIVKQ